MQHDHDCILCYERTNVIGLLPCNHRPICYGCVMKMVEGGFYSCPICKATSKSMLFTDNLKDDYQTLSRSKNILRGDAGSHHMFTSRAVKQHVERESMFICSFASCGTEYQSLNTLKKHLNEVHKRQYCTLCLDNRKCLLSEQTLYSEPQLNSHLADGEIEETGVVSLYHPYCEFCRCRFYDEDTYLKHLKTHEQCFICCKQQSKKYVYYKDYKTLEQHFDNSHYMCKHNNCLDKKFTNVFATEELRDFHYAEAHLGQNFSKKARRNIQCMELTGFYQAEAEEIEEKPSDGLGKNCEKELISISRKIELVNQAHEDGPIDIREFYPEKCIYTKHMATADIVNRFGSMAYVLAEGHPLTLETVDFFRPMAMKNLPRNILNGLIDDLYSYQYANQLKRLFFDGMADIKSFEQYCFQLCQLIEGENPLLFYYMFPQLVRFFKDTNERKKFMDAFYLKRLMQLPYGTQSLLHSCRTYLEFIVRVKTAIEENVCSRILNGKLDLGLYVKQLKGGGDTKDISVFFISREKQKNLYHMVEKIKTSDLLKLNWLLKVGIPLETHNYLTKTIYFSPLEDCVNLFDRICNSELAVIYSYFHIIEDALTNKERFKFEKTKDDVNLLRELLQKNKEKFSKVKGWGEVVGFQEVKKADIKKVVAPKEVVYKISQADLPHLPSPARQQDEQNSSSKSSKVQVGFFNNGAPNLKKWDEEKRPEKRREEVDEENEAKKKVFDLLAAKKKNQATTPPPPKKKIEMSDSQEDSPPQPTIKMTKVVVKETSKPAEVKKPISEAQQIQLAIEESKKSFEMERRKRKDEEDERQDRMRNELDKQRKESEAKREKQIPVPIVANTPPQQKQEDEKKKKLKNVFEVLEYEEEEQRMKKEVNNKPQSPVKQPEKITMKTLEKNNLIKPSVAVMGCDDYPTLSKPLEPKIKDSSKKQQGKGKQGESPIIDKPLITPDEFPSLSTTVIYSDKAAQQQASWVHQVAGRPKSPQPQEVKVRKKKGRTTIEQTVDIFGRN